MATEADKINNGALATLVAVSAISLVGITLAVTALARDQMSAEVAAKEGRAGAEYDQLRAEQLQKLSSGVPIDDAMRRVVADLARDPESATPGSAPAAPQAPASAAPTPAAPAPDGATGALAPTPAPQGGSKGAPARKAAKAATPAAPAGAAPPQPPPPTAQ